MNQSGDEEDSIDLGNVFSNMKKRRRLFACVLVLCLTVGFCAPLLLYQFTKPQLTDSSVVTLQYEVPVKVWQTDSQGRRVQVVPENPEYVPVSDLTAPDGEALDPNQITSAYVLQTALDGIPSFRILLFPDEGLIMKLNIREKESRYQGDTAALCQYKKFEIIHGRSSMCGSRQSMPEYTAEIGDIRVQCANTVIPNDVTLSIIEKGKEMNGGDR